MNSPTQPAGGVLQGIVDLAIEAHAHWDADRDVKVGKILLALAGVSPRYDQRADALHAALANEDGELPTEATHAALSWCAAALQAAIPFDDMESSVRLFDTDESKTINEILDLANAALTPPAPVPADPAAATWTLIGPDGNRWHGPTKFACISAEIDSRVPKTVQMERIMRAAQEEPETSPTAGMNLGERIAHVGGRTNAQGYVEFGSPMAVNALIQHVLRDIQPPLPAAPLHAEGGESHEPR